MTYQLIRSNRKTIGMEIKNGKVIVRAPHNATQKSIDNFINENNDWLNKHLAKAKAVQNALRDIPQLTMEEIHTLADKAMAVIPPRVAYYADKIGVTYGNITIRNQKTKWGSCSAKGNLNFNCLLMLAPQAVLDYVIVHELCHRKEMNHSAKFYAEIERVYPQYKQCKQWLKNNGDYLMARMLGTNP